MKRLIGPLALLLILGIGTGCSNSSDLPQSPPRPETGETTTPPPPTQDTSTPDTQPQNTPPNVSGCSAWEYDSEEDQWYCDDAAFDSDSVGGFFFYNGAFHLKSHKSQFTKNDYIQKKNITLKTPTAPEQKTPPTTKPDTTTPNKQPTTSPQPPKSTGGTSTTVPKSTPSSGTSTPPSSNVQPPSSSSKPTSPPSSTPSSPPSKPPTGSRR